MKLTDQEQVILKAIGHGVAPVSQVIKAVGYPKATVKKILVRLNEKGIVVLHRHDWPQSLAPADRKLMVRIGSDYFNAVSMRGKNPTIFDERIPTRDVATTLLALSRSPFDGMVGAFGDDIRGAYAHPSVLYLLLYAGDLKKEGGEYRIPHETVQKAGQIVDKFYNDKRKSISGKQFLTAWRKMKTKRNPKSKGKAALKKTGRALKGFARGALQSGAEILGAGAMALNPSKKRKTATKGKRLNSDHKDSDHPIEVTKHWRAGPPGYLTPWQRAHHAGQTDLFAHGIKPAKKRNAAKPSRTTYKAEIFDDGFKIHDNHGHHSKKIIYNSHSERITSKREAREQAAQFIKLLREGVFTLENPKRARNASRTISAVKTAKRRARASSKTGHKKTTSGVRSVAKARKASTRRATSNPTRKGMRKGYREAKRISKVTRGRYFSSESGQRKAARHEKRQARKSKRNPSAESIRKTFAGSVNGERDLFFPQGTPAGKLAKLGRLVSITTKAGTIKPVHGTAWLCADTKGKLHIGSTSQAPLIDGPARNFGQVTKLEYEGSKPHLGYRGPIIWFHHMGEGGGSRPSLYADGKGGLKFKGGNYQLTKRGIEG